MKKIGLTLAIVCCMAAVATADDIKRTKLFVRLKLHLDSIRAIDTHDHLRSFDEIHGRVVTAKGKGMTLQSIWAGSYFSWTSRLTPWPNGGTFDQWWAKAKHDFDDARATSFYRYMLPAFRDLYGVDFDTITDKQAKELNRRIFANYRNNKFLMKTVTEKANIELMFIDPFWNRLQFAREYRFSVPLLNVTTMMSGSHTKRFQSATDNVYLYASRKGKPIRSFNDYLQWVERIFVKAVESDAVCLKSTQAYTRTLRYRRVTKQQATQAFGKSPETVTAQQQQDFEDYMFWYVCRLSAKHNLPFQVHTGQARVQGSNPMLLVDVISANQKTKFILFHGGYPWVGETAVIAMRNKNVWIDSVWLPTLSYTMAKRAYKEWLEAVPSDRIMWGADSVSAEGIYASTEFTKRCLAEALAEKVQRGELLEKHARRIGRQIMRDNALKLFPKLKRMLYRKGSVGRNKP